MGWMRSCSVPSRLWCFWVLVDPASPSCCWTTQRWWGIGSHFWHFSLNGGKMDTARCFDCWISYSHKPDPSNYIKNQVLLSLSWDSARIFLRSQMIAQLPLRWLSSFVSVASGRPVAIGQGDPCHVASHLRSALWQGVEKTSCGHSILFNPIQPFPSPNLILKAVPTLGFGPRAELWGRPRPLKWSNEISRFLSSLRPVDGFLYRPIGIDKLPCRSVLCSSKSALKSRLYMSAACGTWSFCWCRIRSFAGFYNCCPKALDPARWAQL